MELPPNQGGFFMSETPWGTRFVKVIFPGWNGLETGGEEGRPGLRINRRILRGFESHPLRQLLVHPRSCTSTYVEK